MNSPHKDMHICPMHPEVQKQSPGLCPECGMQLILSREKKSTHGEHEAFNSGGKQASNGAGKHEGHSTNIFKMKFWVSLALSFPIVVYSDVAQKLLDFEAPVFPGSDYLPLALASIVFFYGGWVFIASAWRELRAKMPGMMTLISLAIITAYAYSVYVTFTGEDKALFWELASLITIMLLGHWMEMRAVSGTQSALKELSKLLPDKAEVIKNGKTELVPLENLNVGDLVLVKPGGKIPADGIVKEGASDVNESLVTGESKPVTKKKGTEVIAGTINGDGSLTIEISKVGEHTFLAGVMRLVEEAQSSKSRLQALSDRAAYYLTIIAISVGTVTFLIWLSLQGASFAVERMVAVLVIACPHALGLAIPLVASISTTKAAQNGFLVKQRLALEMARNVDVVVFDKTGTLTKGQFGIDAIMPTKESNEKTVLQYAASVNSRSEHPLARAMVAEAKKRKLALLKAERFQRIPGKGVSAQLRMENKEYRIIMGNEKLLEDNGVTIDGNLAEKNKTLASQGKTLIFVALRPLTRNGKFIMQGFIALADIIREESHKTITDLQAMGIKPAMITGDSENVAKWVAKKLAIDEYFARVLPEEKSKKIKLLQSHGAKVAMVGDGINDAPALTQADLGIAIGAGTNVALESAGIILVKNDPRDIVKIIKLSRATYAKMIQNLFWATGYNVLAIPLAAGILASKGIFLQPALAALFMSLSTVIVAINASLLKKLRIS